eukprot:gene48264-44559_t
MGGGAHPPFSLRGAWVGESATAGRVADFHTGVCGRGTPRPGSAPAAAAAAALNNAGVRGGGAIAMHIRRGDACVRWAAAGEEGRAGWERGRPCFPTAAYVAGARLLRRSYPLLSALL